MAAARKPAAKKNKSKSKVKTKVKIKAKAAVKPKARLKARVAVKPKAAAKPKAAVKAAPAKPKTAAKKPAAKKTRAERTKSGLVLNHLVAARLLRHSAELFLAVGKQNPKAEKTMILRAKIIETSADRVESDPLGGFEPIEGDDL